MLDACPKGPRDHSANHRPLPPTRGGPIRRTRVQRLAPRAQLALDIFNGPIGFLNACYLASELARAGNHVIIVDAMQKTKTVSNSTAIRMAISKTTNYDGLTGIIKGFTHIGEVVNIAVTSVLQTSAGRMVFGRFESTVSAENGAGARKSDRPVNRG